MTIVVVIILLFQFANLRAKESSLKYSDFLDKVEAGEVQDVTITGTEIKGHLTEAKGHDPFRTYMPLGFDTTSQLLTALRAKKVVINVQSDERTNWASILISSAPFILLIGFWVFFMRQMQSGGNKALSFGKSK